MSGPDTGPRADIGLYNRTAQASSSMVIGQYSTSFRLAARLLEPRTRARVRAIYALVRIADEIVDGAATGAGVDTATQRRLLDALEEETLHAMGCGYSTNLVVHAFAVTARETGIGVVLTTPFFAAMRRDLDDAPFTLTSIAEYIHGSAEVVGLMCLQTFLCDSPARSDRDSAALQEGAARLGAAFQKINFLRDLAADTLELSRNYFPGLDPAHLSEIDKIGILDDIDADLNVAARALPLLPRGCRVAVTAAYALFSRLSARLRMTKAEDLLAQRVRVPNTQKLGLVVGAVLGTGVRAR